jgi:hypothetical protein
MLTKTLAERYNHFQHDFGQNVGQDYEEIVNTLFTPDFKKIANAMNWPVSGHGFCHSSKVLKTLLELGQFKV